MASPKRRDSSHSEEMAELMALWNNFHEDCKEANKPRTRKSRKRRSSSNMVGEADDAIRLGQQIGKNLGKQLSKDPFTTLGVLAAYYLL